MKNNYGIARVMEPMHVLPTSAWRLDNARQIMANEIRIRVKRIHVENTSFKQIYLEAGGIEERIKQKIIDIVIKRGKLHNPVTDTGGVLYGVVEEIGEKYSNPLKLQVGDEVICNASLATLPLYISSIGKIDKAYAQFDAEGYAIAYEDIPLIRRPEGLPMDLTLFTFNESGTLYRLGKYVEGKENFLVVGTNILMNLIYGYAIRKVAGPEAGIVCLLDRKSEINIQGAKVDELI